MNIYDIGQIYFSEEDVSYAKVANRKIDILFSESYILGIMNFFLKFFYFLIVGNKRFPTNKTGRTDVLFYGISKNNKLALQPVIQKFGEDRAISFIYQKYFPSWKLYWHALPHIFDLIREIRNADDKHKKFFKLFFPKFWRMYGCPAVINEMLDTYRPAVVVMANDHLEFNRCLLLMCKERDINTVYVQHASAGTHFPPLQFSYSLLDGMDAYLKYNAIGCMQGNIYLLGGVRFDVIKPEYCKKPEETVIGLAINIVDNEEKVKETCKSLLSLKSNGGKPVKLLLRPHPTMQDGKWKTWCDNIGIEFSTPQEESSFGFIGRSSFIVANQSSIHLDAAMCHKYSVIYNMSDFEGRDEYLFLKNGLVKELDSVMEIQTILDNPSLQMNDEKAIKYFNCSYGTPYEGNVAGIICELINSLLGGMDDSFNEKYRFKIIEKSDEYCVYQFN